jgi:hypothetical protein
LAKVSKRGGFSDRNKIKPENTEIQLKDFDRRTRNQLQNMVSQFYEAIYEDTYYRNRSIQDFLRYVKGTVYAEPVDSRYPCNDDTVFKMINKTIQEDDYDDVLTLIEAVIQYWDSYLNGQRRYQTKSIYEVANAIFQREFIGYRFIDKQITPISDEFEVREIKQALENPYSSVYEHLSKANKLIADRSKPDYENSIKESISAVEALCEVLTGITGKEATLGRMLKKLEENGVVIHSGLKAAFNSLYGYTSDANGIRHAGNIGGPASTFEEAKFMLVSCSAFVNYLIAVSAN